MLTNVLVVFVVFDFVSNLVLLFAVLNISGAWSPLSKYISYVCIFILLGLYIALYVWIHEIRDPADTNYDYETGLGWTIVAVRGLLTIYAIFACIHAFLKERQSFYLIWMLFAVCWLVSLCVFVGIAHYFEAWKRRRIVFGLMVAVQAAIYIILTALFWGGDATAIGAPRGRADEKASRRKEAVEMQATQAKESNKVHLDDDEEAQAGAAAAAAAAGGSAHVRQPSAKHPGTVSDSPQQKTLQAPPVHVYHDDVEHGSSGASGAGGSGAQMDYESVFALKQNVLEKPKRQQPKDDEELDDNEVHFVLHQ